MSLQDVLTTVAGSEFVVAPKVKEWETRTPVSNPIKSISATIAGFSTMVQNLLEHSIKEVYYPIQNAAANYAHLLRHPVQTFEKDNALLIPKLAATPFTAVLSSISWALRSILETPEDISRGVWKTPIDSLTAGTVWQLWMVWRGIHQFWKIFSTPPTLFFHYTSSLLWRAVDIFWDAVAKLTHLDALPDTWQRYVTPSTFSFNPKTQNSPTEITN